MLWLTQVVLAGRDFVVVNMDESGVGQTLAAKKGCVFAKKEQTRHQMKAVIRSKDYTDASTSLLGTICDNPELQPHLPQVILPKYPGGKDPPAHLQERYEDMGYPLVALHGTTGWNSKDSMKDWMKRLRVAVQAFRRSLWILLVLDNNNCHVSREMLLYAKALGILVLLIPPGLTWLLQMLDVHVFAELKRRLRARTTSARLLAASGALQIGEWIDVLGACVQEVLVQTDWSMSFQKCGFTTNLADIREPVRKYISQVDHAPRPPRVGELHEILTSSTRGPKAQDYYFLLLDLPLRLSSSPLGHLPPRAARDPEPALPMETAAPLNWKWSPNSLRALRSVAAPRSADQQLHDISFVAPAASEALALPPPVRTGPAAGTRSQTRAASTNAASSSKGPGASSSH